MQTKSTPGAANLEGAKGKPCSYRPMHYDNLASTFRATEDCMQSEANFQILPYLLVDVAWKAQTSVPQTPQNTKGLCTGSISGPVLEQAAIRLCFLTTWRQIAAPAEWEPPKALPQKPSKLPISTVTVGT
eukprot:1157729-Pelagomonas_calceolata.AAC.3